MNKLISWIVPVVSTFTSGNKYVLSYARLTGLAVLAVTLYRLGHYGTDPGVGVITLFATCTGATIATKLTGQQGPTDNLPQG